MKSFIRRILTFFRQLLGGTNYSLHFGIQKVLVFPETIFLNLLDPNQEDVFKYNNQKGISQRNSA